LLKRALLCEEHISHKGLMNNLEVGFSGIHQFREFRQINPGKTYFLGDET